MKKKIDYNVGLDIGVGSVGWTVTDNENNLLKYNGKNMWGSRIFNEAQTAATRRSFRASKRRLVRRRERINILQSLLLPDMEKEYPNFFPMMRESSLDFDDKQISESILGKKYNLFSSTEITDQKYYKEFPTIYHLRNYLVNTDKKVDIRLVYLAIHHIIKYRGNFLYDGDFSENTKGIQKYLNNILEFLKEKYDIELKNNSTEILNSLVQKNKSKANKKDEIINLFDFEKDEKQIVTNIVNSFLGYSFDLNKIFNTDIQKSKISFANDIENEDEILEYLGDDCNIYESMRTIYSWYILQDILNGETYISEAFIEKYKKYAADLKLIKAIYIKYFKDEYDTMFRKVGDYNYVAYNGKNSGNICKKCKPEEFFTKLNKKLDDLPEECEEKKKIQQEINDNNFLRKINVTDNGAIPHQLHEKELLKILENQSKYYKTIEENKDKIVKLFSFRIPYYVGPLAKSDKQSKWSWVVKKSNDKILPWNFDKVVDVDATAECFIKRMTNTCTYIFGEDVMPKQSLLYSEFCVLNELNNIHVNEKHLAKDTKKNIIDKLFNTKKKVTAKMLKTLINEEGITVKSLVGIPDGENFNSNMASYIDMKNILGKVDDSNYEMCEKLIYWITIFEDKKILKREITTHYGKILSMEQIDKLIKLRYTGWSRLSKKLITGLKSSDGETIIEKLRNTPLNFMQIINEKQYGFDKQLEELMPKSDGTIKYKDVDEIPTSPANKRAIWQAICVVKEIIKVMKYEPRNIYIEFARDEGTKKIMKDNRAKKLLKIYDNLNEQLKYLRENDSNVYKELKRHQSDKELGEKLYLYFIQGGKSMYSGTPLDIDSLSNYEVDHISPQSYIKNDSIDNKALVLKSENQMKKDNLLLRDEIINNMTPYWKKLLENDLISQTKFYRLIKREMFTTDSDREKFVERQLVETRQITKYVTNLIVNSYKDSNVFAIRADLTHGFRVKYKFYKNRNVNNYHHAQDAYILDTIGNIINDHWNGTGKFKYSEYVKGYLNNRENVDKEHGMIMSFINKYIDINKSKKVMAYKDCYLSRMLEEGTGEFYNQTLYSPNDKKNKPIISLKCDRNVKKYGGYSGEAKAYTLIYSYKDSKGKQEYQLVGVPIKVAYDIKNGKQTIEKYVTEMHLSNIKYSDLKIIKSKILMNQEYYDENNEPMRLCSSSEVRSNKELIVDNKASELIYLMNSNEDKLDDSQKEKLNNGYEYMFTYLVGKLKSEYKVFESIYTKISDKLEKFKKLSDDDKKSTINGLISLMETSQGNLTSIGLTNREGRMSGKKFNTDKLKYMTFIDKSVTGMYERRYKVNGLENSCSK